MTEVSDRFATEERFLDAAERLLITDGYATISTRRLAEEAGANHGLVHYYFGSMEHLFVRVLERFTEQLITRQRQMYAADVPFIEKWRQAMAYLDEDRVSGYQKIWFELQALAWNRPDLRERLIRVRHQWAEVLTEALQRACEEYGIDTERFPVEALATLVGTFNEGIILNRLGGVYEGHVALIEMIDRLLMSLEEANASRRRDHEGTVS